MYWTQPNNLTRKEAMVNEVTHNKRRERILCFMGWCVEFNHACQPDFTLFDVSKNSENRERYEKYLDYLKNDRKLGAGTMVEHFTAAIYALKMLHSRYFNHFPPFSLSFSLSFSLFLFLSSLSLLIFIFFFLKYSSADAKHNNIPSIVQLRTLRNEYQRGYERGLKSQNWVELRENDRYLHFEEVQQVLKTLMDEFLEGQKDFTMMQQATTSPLLLKAKQLQRFLLLLFYTSLPPSRALEIRTLQHETSLQFRKTTNTWWLVLSEFKTVRSKGVDSIELDPTSQKILIIYLELFLNEYRNSLLEHWWEKKRKLNPMITQEHMVDEKFLFVPPGRSKQQGYTESAWSQMMCQLFLEKTGISVTINTLRSSFITYFYGSDASENVNLRESMANGMRHSVQEAQKTYDRRCVCCFYPFSSTLSFTFSSFSIFFFQFFFKYYYCISAFFYLFIIIYIFLQDEP
jgi:hypothetical protein